MVRPVNETDVALFKESLDYLTDFADLLSLDLNGAYLNLDAGFDSDYNKYIIREAHMIPNIKVNPRGTKDQDKLQKRFAGFDPEIYKERFTIERVFAWQDTYRKVATTYDRLESIRLGWKQLSYAMMNLRVFFKENL